MHDPMVVAFEIRRPWPRRIRFRPQHGRWHYRRWSPFVTLAAALLVTLAANRATSAPGGRLVKISRRCPMPECLNFDDARCALCDCYGIQHDGPERGGRCESIDGWGEPCGCAGFEVSADDEWGAVDG